MLKTLLAVTLLATPLSATETNVLLFAGSVRKESYNKKLIVEASKMVKELGASPTVIDLSDYPMPFYNEDLEIEIGLPENAKRLRHLMIESRVIVIASPEYNSSIPGILKNALDWASRSEQKGASRDAFKGKTFILLSASPGSLGGKRGLEHLRRIISDVGGIVLPNELSIAEAYTAFDKAGSLKDVKIQQQLKQLLKTGCSLSST